MNKRKVTRREFVRQNSLAGLGAVVAMGVTPTLISAKSTEYQIPAVLGGQKVRTKPWPEWPQWNPATDEDRLIKIIRSGIWSRADVVTEFETKYAALMGAKRCMTTINGTTALIAALSQLDLGGGDEVLVPPYTFIATVQAILQTGAMPVFVDVDPETFQIDPAKIESKITPRTRAILPVHILGLPANMIKIMEIAKKHNLVVVEDACQAWMAEINGKKMGTFGNAGCFSFQNSKNLPMGEGGAVISDDDAFMDKCFSYHNYGNPYGAIIGSVGSGTIRLGTKLRLTEYQAAMGLAQMERLEAQTAKRNENAAYLKSKIINIPGILPYKLYDGVTRAAFHLFPFRYKKEDFNGLERRQFLNAVSAEGVPVSGGYTPLNKMPYIADTFKTKNYRKMYTADQLNYDKWMANNQCPKNDQLCEEAVWIFHSVLLAEKTDMDDIANAIEKVRKNSAQIKSKSVKKE